MRSITAITIVVSAIWPIVLRADEWQRITCIDDPAVTVTLLLKRTATPAEEEFIGFELHNKTENPLPMGNMTWYGLQDVTRRPRGGSEPGSWGGLASGNSYDLLYREGNRPPDGPREDAIPPGTTRRLLHSSIYSFAILGWPSAPGLSVSGKVRFTLEIKGREPLTTPDQGVNFQFDWLPADDAGIASAQQRLTRALSTPKDPFGDAYLIGVLLDNPRVASAVSVDQLLEGLKRHDAVERPRIRDYIDKQYAADKRVIAFALDVIRSKDHLLLSEIASASRIRDSRLVQPLIDWLQSDQAPYYGSHQALIILKRHRDLMADTTATTAQLGKITLGRCPYISTGTYPSERGDGFRWAWEAAELVLTCDRTMVRHLAPYLEGTDVVHDAKLSAAMNNGVSTRACDIAYNAILDLLDRPGERLTMHAGDLRKPQGDDLKDEYLRRDELIKKLKAELDRPAP